MIPKRSLDQLCCLYNINSVQGTHRISEESRIGQKSLDWVYILSGSRISLILRNDSYVEEEVLSLNETIMDINEFQSYISAALCRFPC